MIPLPNRKVYIDGINKLLLHYTLLFLEEIKPYPLGRDREFCSIHKALQVINTAQ